ncbi:MAG: hypothetical protein Unbinned8210contig1002_16 [Prokaryotic dsDNA virus sp.]|nr:MAG: hypothetical protein Unbinned8210contig1002_16 [Prokaryotic dsDNA virus sp.]|tara:strand:+ start:17541 stop:18131 length:591 start_codon:yes stop_codon:yes gene_type:complete
MAITKGINITCDDLQASGGIKQIYVRTWAAGDTITYTNSATAHAISSIKDTGASTATWYGYEFTNQNPALTVSGSRENGSTRYECSLSFMMPRMQSEKSARLQAFMDTCMMVLAVGNNGKIYVMGVSQKYSNEADAIRNQTYVSMSALEGNSGAAYNDENGFTVTLSCNQWENLREYTGTLSVFSGSAGTNEATTN